MNTKLLIWKLELEVAERELRNLQGLVVDLRMKIKAREQNPEKVKK